MRKRLNKSNVDGLEPKAKRYDVSDDQIRGFVCRVNASGSKTMVLRYRLEGRNWSHKLGVIGGDFTVAQARRRAAQVRAEVDAGHNAKIQKLKKRACGYRNRARFREAILFHCRCLDLHPQLRPAHTKS